METVYRFFLAGIIQGSNQDLKIHNQKYRDQIKKILREGFTTCQIICPVEEHPDSPLYTDQKANQVFFEHLNLAERCHCLIAYLPEASMGSSIEMWQASQRKVVVITITPMDKNWVVRILSDKICIDIRHFHDYVESGELEELLHGRFGSKN